MVNALPDTAVTTAGTPVTINVLANDAGAGLVITSFSNPANGSLVFNGDKSFTYTPAAGFLDNDTFSYTVRDAQGTPATAEVTISVMANDGATVATDDFVEVVAGGGVIVPVLANDLAAGGGALQVIAVSVPGHGVVNVLANQSIRYVPQTGFIGLDSFTYMVRRECLGGRRTDCRQVQRETGSCRRSGHHRGRPTVTIDVLANDACRQANKSTSSRSPCRSRAGSTSISTRRSPTPRTPASSAPLVTL